MCAPSKLLCGWFKLCGKFLICSRFQKSMLQKIIKSISSFFLMETEMQITGPNYHCINGARNRCHTRHDKVGHVNWPCSVYLVKLTSVHTLHSPVYKTNWQQNKQQHKEFYKNSLAQNPKLSWTKDICTLLY